MLDGLHSVEQLFDKVKEVGQKAVALTDHGTMAAHFDAYKASKKTGVKLIPGCEMYYVSSYDMIEVDGKMKKPRRNHIVLLAQNHIGYKNLLQMNFIGFQNQHQAMVIDWDNLSAK
jgi:DNA polymerase-3 subunit alpha